jgi:hypothetical protein
MDQNIEIVVNFHKDFITIDEEKYSFRDGYRPKPRPWECFHEYRAMLLSVDGEWYDPTLSINLVDFDDLPEAPARERAPLARAKTTINMNGQKKSASFPLLLSGKLVPVSVQLNLLTKFSKLQVGKNIVTAK